jgi:thymidylate synthase ThyX
MGLPKEVARLPVPVGRYSRMRAHANLRNWLAFLTLRSDIVPSGRFAQFEIRQFANPVGAIIKDCFPRTYEIMLPRAQIARFAIPTPVDPGLRYERLRPLCQGCWQVNYQGWIHTYIRRKVYRCGGIDVWCC